MQSVALEFSNADNVMAYAMRHRYDPVGESYEAYDRTGLLGDISGLLAAMRVNVINMKTQTDLATSIAHLQFTIEIHSIDELIRLLAKLNNMPNIISAARSAS